MGALDSNVAIGILRTSSKTAKGLIVMELAPSKNSCDSSNGLRAAIPQESSQPLLPFPRRVARSVRTLWSPLWCGPRNAPHSHLLRGAPDADEFPGGAMRIPPNYLQCHNS